MGVVTQNLSGWGRFPVEACRLYRPEKRSELLALLRSGTELSYISRGLGRSYGDAALNSAVILHTRLNRFLSFDEHSGVLDCEAGVSFAEILQYFVPRGFFPPVTPGTKFVTLGGAIAADIHGKNHHRDGSLGNFLLHFRLLTATGEVLACSPTENREAFWATIGGMGLTGAVQRVRLRLRPIESAYMRVDYEKARNLAELLDAMTISDANYEYSVAWVDCLARGEALGRSVLMRGNHACRADVPVHIGVLPAAGHRAKLSIPFDMPSALLNRSSVRAFNAFYFAAHREVRHKLVEYEKFFYPLDSISDWNRLYGRRGFVQYQFVVPEQGGREGMAEVLERLAESGRGSFLAVLKRMGEANAGLLSFPIRGYTLALDIPVSRDLPDFLHRLDEIVIGYGGRIYLAKDAVLSPEAFAASYPQLNQFRAIKQKLDPVNRVSSSLGRRLRIVEG
jgi:decaprenylphospho-beta-D-ribofuranose 2-oxidase